MISVTDSCVGCGLCVPVCPHELLRVEQGRLLVKEEGCFACGHCQAACPHGALSLAEVRPELQLQNVEEILAWQAWGQADMPSLVQLMRSRRSCRNYSRQPVEQHVLEDLVKIATTAPSGTNSQGWTFHLAASRQEVVALGELTARFYQGLNTKAAQPWWRLLARFVAADSLGNYYRRYYRSVQAGLEAWQQRGEDRLFHGATAAILVGGQANASCPGEDALLASQNILLAAHAMGLGSCLIGFVVEAIKRDRQFQRQLQLADGESIYAVIGLGYPTETYHQVAGRRLVRPHYLQLAAQVKKK